jgi:hypothetical protein
MYLTGHKIQLAGIYIPLATQHLNNFKHVTKKSITTIFLDKQMQLILFL